jgi:hypothetical protein
MDSAVSIDHAPTSISMHSSCAGVMVRIGIGAKACFNFHSTNSRGFERRCDDDPQALKIRLFRISPLPK